MDENIRKKPWGMDLNTFCMLMHLSQLTNGIVPGAGIALPIIMWATQKDEFSVIDQHGKIIFNWLLSSLIYSLVSGILVLILIGILGLIAVSICSLVFAIIGGVKANDGEVWEYPLCIHFFK